VCIFTRCNSLCSGMIQPNSGALWFWLGCFMQLRGNGWGFSANDDQNLLTFILHNFDVPMSQF
jgi:hypothetical protein